MVESETVAKDKVIAPSKQKFQNLDYVLNLESYDSLEQLEPETYKYSDYKWAFAWTDILS